MVGTHSKKAIKIKQLDVDTGEEIAVYNSINDAAYDNFISHKTIRNALRNNGYVRTKPLRFEEVKDEDE